MILITRPKKEAIELKRKLSLRGISSHIDSMQSFKNKKKLIIPNKDTYFLLASIQAAKSLLLNQKNYKKISEYKFIIIGKKTENLLRSNGAKKIFKVFPTSKEFLIFLTKAKAIKKIIYLSGSKYNKKMIIKIKKMGISIKLQKLYETNVKAKFNSITVSKFKNKRIKMIAFYSEQAAVNFFNLMTISKLEKKHALECCYICISQNVANFVFQVLPTIKRNKVYISKKPNNLAIISLIETLHNQK